MLGVFLSLGQDLLPTWNSQFLLDRLVSVSLESICSASLMSLCHHLCVGVLNSVPHACITGSLPTELCL